MGRSRKGRPVVSHNFTPSNYGTTALTIGTLSLPGGYTLVTAPATTINPSLSTTFTVSLSTSTPGTFTGNVSFINNDTTATPFSFGVTGFIIDPLAVVTGNGETITKGSATPNTSNGTNFGSAIEEYPNVDQTFTIANNGNTALTVGTVKLPSGYILVSAPAASVSAGGSTTFTVGLTTKKIGAFTGNVTIPTNDPANNPFSFKITGSVIAIPAGVDVATLGAVGQ